MKLRLPRSRRTWAVLFLLFSVCTVGGHYGLRWYAYQRGERELRAVLAELDQKEPGWRYEEILASRPKIPDAENGARIVEKHCKGLQGTKEIGAIEKEYALLKKKGGDGSALQMTLKPFASRLDALREIHRLPNGRFEWPNDEPPHYFDFLNASKLMAPDALAQAISGDVEKAGQTLLAIAHLAGYCEGEPTMLGNMLCMANWVVLVDSLQQVSERVDIPAPYLEGISRALATMRGANGFQQAMRMERASHHRMFERIQPGSGFATPQFRPLAADTMLGRVKEDLRERAQAPNRSHQEAEFLRMWSKAIAAFELKPKDRERVLGELSTESLPSELGDAVLKNLRRFAGEHSDSRKRLLLYEAAINCQLHRAKTGAWPVKIEELAGRMPLSTEFDEPLELRIEGDSLTVLLRDLLLTGNKKPLDLSFAIKSPRK